MGVALLPYMSMHGHSERAMGTLGTHADAKELRHYDAYGNVEGIDTAHAVPRDHELSQVVAWHLEVLLL